MENKAFQLNTLQQQLKQLGHEPDFIAHFLHEGAYVFDAEKQSIEAADTSQEGKSTSQSTPEHKAPESQKPSAKMEDVERGNETIVASTTEKEAAPPKHEIPAVQTAETPYWVNKVVVLLPPEPSIREVQLLHKILAASCISDDQVCIQEKLFQAKSLGQFAGSRMVLSFGAVTDFKADYQLRSKAITVIMADKLAQIEADVEAKKKLWAGMKSFFS